jgi:hypothetical protein
LAVSSRTAAVRRLKMLHAALMAASVGRIAAFHKRAERQLRAGLAFELARQKYQNA